MDWCIWVKIKFTESYIAQMIKESTPRTVNEKKFSHLWHLVGNTPMLEISYLCNGEKARIFAKCEHYNLTGSIKDRMALYILQRAYERDEINSGDKIVEATSGNTGISFSAIGRSLGHQVTIIMPDWLSKERISIIQSFGAEIILVSKEQGGFLGSIRMADEMKKQDENIFLPQQFENYLNAEAHQRTTGPEIWEQLESIGLRPDAFVAGVGTGGTVMGISQFLKMKDPRIKVHPLEPAESPTLTTGFKVGSHRIQGISDEFIPAIVEFDRLNEVVSVSDGDSIIMAQKMARQLGIATGISSGANVLGAIKLQQQLGKDSVVVTVLPDSNKKYLSTDLVNEEPMLDHHLSKDVNFIDYQPIRRLGSR